MKAQILSTDFVFGAVIFMVVLLIVIPLWFYVDFQLKTVEERKETENKLIRTTEMLTKSPGAPEGWNETSALSIGFSSGKKYLNASKIQSFMKIDYQDSKKKLGLEGYEFYLYFSSLNGSLLVINGSSLSYGLNYTETASEIFRMERPVMLKGNSTILAMMSLILWR